MGVDRSHAEPIRERPGAGAPLGGASAPADEEPDEAADHAAAAAAAAAERVDSGLIALAMIAGYYRVAADPAQLRHELALGPQVAAAEDLVRAAKRLKFKARLLTGRAAKRLDAIPYPAIIGLKTGGFALLGATPGKGRVRVVDPLARSASDVTVQEAEALASGEVVLITRRFAGAGVDPATFGFRWFIPSILRYRKPLAEVLVASLFVQASPF